MKDVDSQPEYYSDDDCIDSRQPKSRRVLSLKLAFLTLISAIGYSLVGNTFAANVQLGSGRLEFGQGVLTSTACDSRVIVTPFATFANASGAAAKYKLTDIQLSDISTNCYGRDFVIKVYDSATATPLDIYQSGGSTNYNALRVYNNNGTFTLADSGLSQSEISAVTGGFKVTLFNNASPAAIALAEAGTVSRITVESVPHDGTLIQSMMPSGSLFFTSPNQSIDYASNNAFVLGTGDFTLELWAKLPSTQSNETFYDAGDDVNNAGGFAFWIENNLLLIRRNGLVGDITVPMENAWRDGNYHHFAAVRGNGKYRIFVDGVLKVEAADSGHTINRTSPRIGRLSAHQTYDLDGDLRNLRLVKGTALYSANFTPPATPLTKVSGTLLLLLAQDSNNPYYDSSDNHFTPSNSSGLPTWRAP